MAEQNAKAVVCCHKRCENEETAASNHKKKPSVMACSGTDAARTILYQKNYDVSAWGKLFRRETFDGILFPTGVNFEDIPTVYKALYAAERVVFTTEELYYYQIRENSIITERFSPKKLDGIKAAQLMLDTVERDYPELRSAAKSKYVATHFHILAQIPEEIPEKGKIIGNIQSVRKDVLLDGNVKLRVKIACLLSYISFDFTVWLLHLL